MKAIVIGATGTIGRAVVANLQNEGYGVFTASRNATASVDIEKEDSIEMFCASIGQVDVIVCCAGNVSFGKLNDLSSADLEHSVSSKLLGQVNVVKKGLSHLNPNGVIVVTGGLLAYKPWPGTSAIAMANAGLEGFVKAVSKEMTDDRRILIVHPPHVAETAAAKGLDSSNCPAAKEVAEAYLQAIQGQKNGEPVFVGKFTP